MGDNNKPFVCMHPGCEMSFINEDHLSVHRMKHEMHLALTPGSKPGSFLMFADQTPTPTKFLKNCEEIGLFNELTKNPFEEAFKKASESHDGKSVESLHLQLAGLDPDTLHTPTPHLGIHVHTPDVGVPSQHHKQTEFIPLPGPDNEMGSTIATTPGGSSMCGTPRSATQRKSPGTPAGTPTSSTMGLPFKLKLKREPLGESELSMLPGGVVSPSVPKKSPISSQKEFRPDKTGLEQSVALTMAKSETSQAKVQAPSPAKIAMVTPTPMVISSQPASIPGGVMTTIASAVASSSVSGSPLLLNNSNAAAKNAQYYLQVMIQMPNGEMMPVQIPAALSSASTVSMATSAVTTTAKSTLPTIATATPALSAAMATTVQQPLNNSGAASSLTKQKLKAALQQSVLSSNMRIMSEAVERISTDASPMSHQTVAMDTSPYTSPAILQSVVSPLRTSTAIRPQTLVQMPISQQLSPVSTTTTLSPDMEYADFDEDDDEDPSGKRARRSDDDPDERRKKFLERNRAAAARCRQKKKSWITNLEKKADDLINTNSKLQQEVTMLRSEVAQLKTLLLAHKDCPITLQLQNAGMMSPVTPVETQYSSISSTSQNPIIIDSVSTGSVPSSINCIPITMVAPVTMTTPVARISHSNVQSMAPIVIEIKDESYGNN